MTQSTYSTQISSQLDFYLANSARNKADKKQVQDVTQKLIKLLALFSSSTSATIASDMLQEAMNDMNILSSLLQHLYQQDEVRASGKPGPLSTDTLTSEQVKNNLEFDNGYFDKISLTVLTFQSEVAYIIGAPVGATT